MAAALAAGDREAQGPPGSRTGRSFLEPAAALISRLAVPMAVLGIVHRADHAAAGLLLDLLIVHRHHDVGHRPDGGDVHHASRWSSTSFPTTLLLLTLFRLALNISSSRLILLNGNTGTSAAGDVIEAFGNFVVGGNYIIGAVIFLVLIAIQYVVINHGAVRISEVTARFTLDALPGKQMSIDSDLNAGLIDEAEARAPPQAAGGGSRVLRRDGRRVAASRSATRWPAS